MAAPHKAVSLKNGGVLSLDVALFFKLEPNKLESSPKTGEIVMEAWPRQAVQNRLHDSCTGIKHRNSSVYRQAVALDYRLGMQSFVALACLQ